MKKAITDKKELTPRQLFMEGLKGDITDAFSKAGKSISRHLNSDRAFMFMNVSVRNNPKLLECTPMSIVSSLVAISLSGLDVASNEAYVVPYKNYKTGKTYAIPIISYRGDIKNMYRFKLDKDTPLIKSVYASEVRENDLFDVTSGSSVKVIHKPNYREERGDVFAYYAIASLNTGGEVFSIMTKKEVEDYANKYSKSKDYNTKKLTGPWASEFDEMAKKTVVHKLKKMLPSSFINIEDYMDTELFDNRVVEINPDGGIIPVDEELEAEGDDININPDTGEIIEEIKEDIKSLKDKIKEENKQKAPPYDMEPEEDFNPFEEGLLPGK